MISPPAAVLLTSTLANLDLRSAREGRQPAPRSRASADLGVDLRPQMNALLPVMDRGSTSATVRRCLRTADEVVRWRFLSRLYGTKVECCVCMGG